MIEKILNEISRLKKELDGYSALEALDYIESYINIISREPASDDLEEEIKNYIQKEYPDGMGFPNVPKIASHFAEWQEKKMLGIAEAFYQQGRYEQEQEMMKDAVELHIVESFNPVGTENEKPHGFTALCYNAEYPTFYPITGQTIKVIPIKEI
jgi:hypothetical protein